LGANLPSDQKTNTMDEERDPSQIISEALSRMNNFEKLNEALVILKSCGWISDYDDERVDQKIREQYGREDECTSWSQLYEQIEEGAQEEFLGKVGSFYFSNVQ